ncbi:uncharacterized protein [Rhodnius prolixus]|uniref:uncharacterized protein n=1 Tax=Rhodnius prolixus TaxID=13249 RepID=UPI003D18D4F2
MSSEQVNATSSVDEEFKPEDYIFSDNESSYLMKNMNKRGAATPFVIIGAWLVNEEAHYHVVWQRNQRIIGRQICPHHIAKAYMPQLLIKYLESRIVWWYITEEYEQFKQFKGDVYIEKLN